MKRGTKMLVPASGKWKRSTMDPLERFISTVAVA